VRALTGPTQFVVRRTEGATTTEISTMVDHHADPTLDFRHGPGAVHPSPRLVSQALSSGPSNSSSYNPLTAIPGTVCVHR